MITAAAVIGWLETLRITEGPLVGEPFKVLPFQRRFVRGLLKNAEAALSIARGNGKTTLSGAIGACALAGELAIPRGQIALVASSFTQATICVKHAYWFLRERVSTETYVDDVDGKTQKRWRWVDNSHECKLEDRKTGSYLRAFGSDPARAHGLAPVVVIADEPAKWRRNDGPAMYAAMVTALGKQPNAKLIAIGTQPDDEHHWFAQMLKGGPGIYAQIHAAADAADDFAWSSVRAANPALSYMPELRVALHREREKAKAGGPALAMWRALRLNKGTPEISEREVIVSVENWQACVFKVLPPREGPVAIGFDLGGSSSMTALVAYWPETGRLEAYGAFPAEPGLAERGKNDFVGDRYLTMAQRGEIRTYPGKVTPVGAFLRDMARRLEEQEVIAAVADRYRQKEAEQALAEAGLAWPMEWRATGAGKDGSADIRAFQAEVLEAHLRCAPLLLMESAIAECTIGRDTNGNPRLDKARAKGRIDALQAAVLAVGAGRRWRLPSGEDPLEERAASDYVLCELYA